jgi:hypothetical protein
MLLAEEQGQHNGRKQEDGEEKHEDIEAHLVLSKLFAAK